MYVCMYVCMYIYILYSVQMLVCVYVYVYIYILYIYTDNGFFKVICLFFNGKKPPELGDLCLDFVFFWSPL